MSGESSRGFRGALNRKSVRNVLSRQSRWKHHFAGNSSIVSRVNEIDKIKSFNFVFCFDGTLPRNRSPSPRCDWGMPFGKWTHRLQRERWTASMNRSSRRSTAAAIYDPIVHMQIAAPPVVVCQCLAWWNAVALLALARSLRAEIVSILAERWKVEQICDAFCENGARRTCNTLFSEWTATDARRYLLRRAMKRVVRREWEIIGMVTCHDTDFLFYVCRAQKRKREFAALDERALVRCAAQVTAWSTVIGVLSWHFQRPESSERLAHFEWRYRFLPRDLQ